MMKDIFLRIRAATLAAGPIACAALNAGGAHESAAVDSARGALVPPAAVAQATQGGGPTPNDGAGSSAAATDDSTPSRAPSADANAAVSAAQSPLAAWFATHPLAVRAVGTGVRVVVAADPSWNGKVVRAALVRDADHTVVARAKAAALAGEATTLTFPPAYLPLPTDANALTDTYSVYACRDTADRGLCDGTAWVQPIGSDYMNAQGDTGVHFEFDARGRTDAMANGFTAVISMTSASPTTYDAALLAGANTPDHFSLTFALIFNTDENPPPGSGAGAVLSNMRIVDQATSEVVYDDTALGGAPLIAAGNAGEVALGVLLRGRRYNVLLYNSIDAGVCVDHGLCGTVDIATLDSVFADQVFILPLGHDQPLP